MSIWRRAKQMAAARRLIEEQRYAQVLLEIESGVRRDGLWAKAIQNGAGNELEAKALYIKYRIQSMQDENQIAQELSELHARGVKTASVNPIDSYDENGYTPLMRAVKAADLRAVVLLIEQGADPKLKDGEFGTSTALNMAGLLRAGPVSVEERIQLQRIIDVLEPIT